MFRVKAVYQNGQLVLEQPLELAEGTEVELLIDVPAADEEQAWELACSRLEEEWDLADPSYDDWRRVYGIAD